MAKLLLVGCPGQAKALFPASRKMAGTPVEGPRLIARTVPPVFLASKVDNIGKQWIVVSG
jgi:hypothetical protein